MTDVRSISVQYAGLSVRAFNALLRAQKKTLGDVADMTLSELRKTIGLGAKSVVEIQTVLHQHGLSLKQENHDNNKQGGQFPMVRKYDVLLLDMWATPDGGWTENDHIKIGTLNLKSKSDVPTDIEVLTALVEPRTVGSLGHPIQVLSTKDRRRVYADVSICDGEIEVGMVKGREPMILLRERASESLS